MDNGACKDCPNGQIPMIYRKKCMQCPADTIARNGKCVDCPYYNQVPNIEQTYCVGELHAHNFVAFFKVSISPLI